MVRRFVACSLPAAALTRLTEDFATHEWEYRRMGFLVVRGSGNRACFRR
jgi:hypothetical protein